MWNSSACQTQIILSTVCHGFDPDCQYHYDCLEVLNNVWECVRCHCFTGNVVRICSLTLQWSFSMSCMLFSLNYNHLERSSSYSVTPGSAEGPLSNVPSTVMVPVGLHHQRNICYKTWHKKPGTEVCIGCQALYWQFYQQWADESCCVAPVCCLHTVVPGIVCDSGDSAVKFRLFRNSSCLSPYYSPFNPICTLFNGYIWLFFLIT
jgi:hypothetical protein